jgi:hypothetical protein
MLTSLHRQSNRRVTGVESHNTDAAQARLCTKLNHTSQHAVDSRGPALSERHFGCGLVLSTSESDRSPQPWPLAFTSASTDAGGSANHPAISRRARPLTDPRPDRSHYYLVAPVSSCRDERCQEESQPMKPRSKTAGACARLPAIGVRLCLVPRCSNNPSRPISTLGRRALISVDYGSSLRSVLCPSGANARRHASYVCTLADALGAEGPSYSTNNTTSSLRAASDPASAGPASNSA